MKRAYVAVFVVLSICLLSRIGVVAAFDSLDQPSAVQVTARKLLHSGIDHESHLESPSPAPSDIPTESLSSKRIVGNKIGALFIFFAVPFLGCIVAWFFSISPELLKYGLLFASGLFLALAMEHLIGDAVAGFADLTASPYPTALLLVLCGYFFTWFTDLVVHAIWERKAERDKAAVELERLSEEKKPVCCKKPASDAEEQLVKCSGVDCKCSGGNCQCQSSVMEFSELQEVARAGAAVESAMHSLGPNAYGVKELAFADLVLLLLALCFHATFEGVAVGLTSSVYDTWNLTLTIVLHKFFEGAALGATMKEQNKDRVWWTFFLYAAAFSITAPIGIAIGIVLDSTVLDVSAHYVQSIGNAIAAGVFIFVAITHLMVKGFRKSPKDRWFTPFWKWLACLLGATTFSLLELRSS